MIEFLQRAKRSYIHDEPEAGSAKSICQLLSITLQHHFKKPKASRPMESPDLGMKLADASIPFRQIMYIPDSEGQQSPKAPGTRLSCVVSPQTQPAS